MRIKYRYTLGKALLLKHKGDLRSIIEARIRLDELVKENTVENELRILALVNICNLLVKELEITNDETILDEIGPYFTELLNDALESKNYPLFEKVLKMAEDHQLFQLYDKITMDYDRFIKNIDKWRELKKLNFPIEEMFKKMFKNIN